MPIPPGKGWDIDHVIPLARGGQHTIDNVKVACAHCNTSKRADIR